MSEVILRDHERWIFANTSGSFEALKEMTSVGGELALLTGDFTPYPGKLGVIEEGSYADILIVDGNPLEDIPVLGGNKEWLKAAPHERGIETINLIMKDSPYLFSIDRVQFMNSSSSWLPSRASIFLLA